jgi:putative transposase
MSLICRWFGLSKAGFYKHRKLEAARTAQADEVLEAVRVIRSRQPRVGARKLWKMLSNQGIRIGRDRLFRLLSDRNLLSGLFRKRRSFSKGPRTEPIPNLLASEPIDCPGQAIVTDITYLQTAEGMLYLSVYLDYASRSVLSWELSASLHRAFCLAGLRKAIAKLGRTEGVIHHSDHGSQYTSKEYRALLRRHGMRMSMTGLLRCYDNAVVERFHSTLKNEFGLGHIQKSARIAEQAVRDSILIYNHERLHESLGYRTPASVFDQAA